jgi:hypothetical protein
MISAVNIKTIALCLIEKQYTVVHDLFFKRASQLCMHYISSSFKNAVPVVRDYVEVIIQAVSIFEKYLYLLTAHERWKIQSFDDI